MYLIIDSNLYILDEPFNGLDPNVVDLIIRLISEHNKKSKNLMLLTSHNLEHLKRICHEIYELKNRDSLHLLYNHVEVTGS